MSQHILDVRRLLCPMPVIKTSQKVKELSSGDILEIICTDPGVKQDIPAWCRIHKHEIISVNEIEKEIIIIIKIK